MRTVIGLAVMIFVYVGVSGNARERVQETLGAGPAGVVQVPSSQVPAEFRSILSGMGAATAGALNPKAGVLPGVFGSGGDAEEDAGPRPFADTGSPRQVARVKRDTRAHLRAVSALTRRVRRDPARAAAVLDRVYSRRVLAAAGPERRAELARKLAGVTSTTAQRVRVLAFQGVFVTGDQAIAVLDYARGVRPGRGGRWRELPSERWQVALRREAGTWRFERGLER